MDSAEAAGYGCVTTHRDPCFGCRPTRLTKRPRPRSTCTTISVGGVPGSGRRHPMSMPCCRSWTAQCRGDRQPRRRLGRRAGGEPRSLRPRASRPLRDVRQVDWTRHPPGLARPVVASLQDRHAAVRRRQGLEGPRTPHPGRTDKLLMPNDPRLVACGPRPAISLPVLIHTADPVAFFEPLDERNERLEELAKRPDWSSGSVSSRVRPAHVVARGARRRSPGRTFIGAHVGCYAEDLGWVDRMLTPTRTSTSTSRPASPSWAASRAPPARSSTGTRTRPVRHRRFPTTAEAYRRYFRFLETADEHFPYSGSNPPGAGRWTISGLDLDQEALRQVYGANAARLVPALRNTVG